MTLSHDFEDFIVLLNSHEVEYMVVGGYAMAFHGSPRYTGDLDIWIDISESNATKLVSVIKKFGFASLNFQKSDFLKENMINQIGYPPLRIDIITNIEGVFFQDAVLEMQIIDVDDLKINYIGLSDLIKNKSTTGREKDKVDVKTLEKAKSKKK